MSMTATAAVAGRIWVCTICDFRYDETLGAPDHGIAPGTRFEDIPADWICPDCGMGKADFVLLQD
jgi:rubredoxin